MSTLPYLTLTTAALRLGIAPRDLRQLVNDGRLFVRLDKITTDDLPRIAEAARSAGL